MDLLLRFMRPSPGIVFDFPAVDVMMCFSSVGILQITLFILFSQNQEDACMKLTVLIVFCI